ncbi:MAG: tRNA(His) guanylyltransferase Thg1 family protein [Methanobacteriaceae archaeon]
MKDCEIYSDFKIPKGSSIILRLDGRGFSKLSQNLNLNRPYDDDFKNIMAEVSLDLFKEFGPLFIYTFSDEINILLGNIPFSGRIEKLDSVLASFASSSFTLKINSDYFTNRVDNSVKGIFFKDISETHTKNININRGNLNSTSGDNKEYTGNKINPISFDCRVIPISREMVPSYFKWRQDEAWRNCINGYGYWTLREKLSKVEATRTLNGLKISDVHELLYNNGLNINDVDNWKKRGISIYRRNQVINSNNTNTAHNINNTHNINNESNGYGVPNEVLNRTEIIVDENIPQFDENFFRNLNII